MGVENPASPCTECSPNTPETESLASAVGNFIYHFFGSLTKSVDDAGNVTWTLPCDLATGVEGNPRVAGEGLACYFKRLLSEGVVGKNGQNAFASTLAPFTVPAVNSTVDVAVSDVEPFAVNQFVWLEVGGFYTVEAILANVVTLMNLVPPPANLGAGGTVPINTRIFPSGPAALPGTKGDKGDKGDAAVSSYTYIAFASDNIGSDFSLNVPASNSKFLAIKNTSVAISSPVVTDFVGLWTRYQGIDGAAGPSGAELPKSWQFLVSGIHPWICPAGVTSIRARVYAAGGGGGGGASAAHGSGNGYGGGGGEFVQGVIPVTVGVTYNLTVGAAGSGGTGGDASANGTAGGLSKISSGATTYLQANGGAGGSASFAGSPSVGAGGTGGSGTIVPEVQQAGLAGGSGTTDTTLGGHAGSLGAGGLGGGAGGTPGGGGGAGLGDAGGPGAAGLAGGVGAIQIEAIA